MGKPGLSPFRRVPGVVTVTVSIFQWLRWRILRLRQLLLCSLLDPLGTAGLMVELGQVWLEISDPHKLPWRCPCCTQVFRGFVFTVPASTVPWEGCLVCGFVSGSFSVHVLRWRGPSPGLCSHVEGLSCWSVRWKLASHFGGIFDDKRSRVCCQSQHWSGAGCTTCVSPTFSCLSGLFTSSISSPCKAFPCQRAGLLSPNWFYILLGTSTRRCRYCLNAALLVWFLLRKLFCSSVEGGVSEGWLLWHSWDESCWWRWGSGTWPQESVQFRAASEKKEDKWQNKHSLSWVNKTRVKLLELP